MLSDERLREILAEELERLGFVSWTQAIQEQTFAPSSIIVPALAAMRRAIAESASHQSGKMEDGWIEWRGGECPVDLKAWVEVKLRGVEGPVPAPAMGYDWEHSATHTHWNDIIAYRLVSPPSSRSGETDWRNELIEELREYKAIGVGGMSAEETFRRLADHLARRVKG